MSLRLYLFSVWGSAAASKLRSTATEDGTAAPVGPPPTGPRVRRGRRTRHARRVRSPP